MKARRPPFSVQLDHINAICQAALATPEPLPNEKPKCVVRPPRDYDQFEAFISSQKGNDGMVIAG